MMTVSSIRLKTASAALAVLIANPLIGPAAITANAAAEADGKALVFDRKKGNCLACHMIENDTTAGNIAPPLIAMKSRYPDRATLKAKIADASMSNPESMMPLFGKHKILTDAEIEKIVDYVMSL